MEQIELHSLAKINLSLDVTGKRPNGYHDVEMVMQTVYLSDTVRLRLRPDGRIRLTSNLPFLPTDDRNIAVKAVRLLQKECGLSVGADISLHKRIPVAAGLAGGSSNAAAVLFGMNRLLGLGLPRERLARLGTQLGADVPYCLLRGTALARGIGEELTPLPAMPSCTVLLAKPPVSVSTKEVYEALEQAGTIAHPDTKGMLDAIQSRDLKRIAGCMGNVLEPVTERKHPVVGQLRQIMLDAGAMGAMMSGSGPTVFGLFDRRQAARAAQKEILDKGLARQVYITRIHNRRDFDGCEI